jgi:hypothetical protein
MPKYPCGIKLGDVAGELYAYAQNLKSDYAPEDIEDEEGNAGGDVRFRLYEWSNAGWNGGKAEWAWEVLTGDSQYDQDHRGYWGCGYVEAGASRAACREVAREIIEEALDARAQGE